MLAELKMRARSIVGRQLRRRMNLEMFRTVHAAGIGLWTSYRIASSQRPQSTLLRLRGRTLLAPAIEALRAADMRPFLMWGSLLGHRREGGFIAHDHDVDLSIMAPELAGIDALRVQLADRGLVLRGISPFLFRIEHCKLAELWIDIWVQYEVDGYFVVSMHDYRHRRGCFVYRLPVDLFGAFAEVEFEGCRILVPCETDRLLDLCYGNWRIPDPKFYDDMCPCATLEAAMPEVVPACTPFWPEPPRPDVR